VQRVHPEDDLRDGTSSDGESLIEKIALTRAVQSRSTWLKPLCPRSVSRSLCRSPRCVRFLLSVFCTRERALKPENSIFQRANPSNSRLSGRLTTECNSQRNATLTETRAASAASILAKELGGIPASIALPRVFSKTCLRKRNKISYAM